MLAQVFLNGLIAGFTYAMIALSFSLTYNPARFFNFAQGAVFAWGAYFAYVLHALLIQPWWMAIPLAMGVSAGLGIILDIAIYRPLRQKGAMGLVLMLASLGLYVLLQNCISLQFGDSTISLRIGEVEEGFRIFGARVTRIQVLTVCISFTSIVLMRALLKTTKIGKELRAVSNDAELAFVRGLNNDRIILLATALGSALMGLAAILIALDVDMTPTMGLSALMMGVVATITGGIGSVPGTLLGGLLLGLAQHFGVWAIGSQWQEAIAFAILILFLLLRPQGFLGKPLRKAAV